MTIVVFGIHTTPPPVPELQVRMQVFGMSADKPKALASWKDKNNFNISLLSGTDEASSHRPVL